MLEKSKRRGYSLIEVVGAIVILAGVAATIVATVAPLRKKSLANLDAQNIADLNAVVQKYYWETGLWPDRSLTRLNMAGYTTTRTIPTPYGGYYQWDNIQRTVYNPVAPKVNTGPIVSRGG